MNLYILDGHTPIATEDLHAWSKWFSEADRHVARTEIDDIVVSTVFLGIDHNFENGNPLLFETMIFGSGYDGYQERYSNWEEAEQGHKIAVDFVQKGK